MGLKRHPTSMDYAIDKNHADYDLSKGFSVSCSKRFGSLGFATAENDALYFIPGNKHQLFSVAQAEKMDPEVKLELFHNFISILAELYNMRQSVEHNDKERILYRLTPLK